MRLWRGGDMEQVGPTPMVWQLRIRKDVSAAEIPPEERWDPTPTMGSSAQG